MIAASWPRGRPDCERLLHLDPAADAFSDRRIADLPGTLRAGDLLVVNDAATLPASLPAETSCGTRFELRLLGIDSCGRTRAALFGSGDWRTDTDRRSAPPALMVGETLRLATVLHARIERVSPASARLVTLRIAASRQGILDALYRYGRPVQYAYLADDLDLEDVQTGYAGRPWAVEMPSAGRPLRWSVLLEARRRGVGLAALTHAAGLSALGCPELDRGLPLRERFEIPERTARAVASTRAAGGSVVAVGTSVVRALESAAVAEPELLRSGPGTADLRIDPRFEPRIVDGLLSNMHEPGEPHFELLRAFVPDALLRRASAHAERHGYLLHEFGDSCLILPAA